MKQERVLASELRKLHKKESIKNLIGGGEVYPELNA
jgi:hypothetical protein